MSKPTKQARIRTAAALKADAQLLSGSRSRVATAAAAASAAPAPAESGSVGELWLYGVVGGWWRGFDAESVANALRSLDVDTLHVRIHSPGGRASDGVAIGNLLRNHRAKVIAIVDGLAASAASVIAIAADQVIMCPGSQVMVHDATLWTGGNAAQLRRDADWLDAQSNNYAGVYAYKAGGTAAQWREVMLANEGEGTWYTADEAVTAKLADTVGTLTAISSPPVAPEDELDELDDGEELLARIEHDLTLLERDVHPAARAAWNGERHQAPRTHKPPTASAGGSITTQGTETAVTFTDQQLTTMRDKLGLPETADEGAILAAVEAVVDESLEDRPANTNAAVPEGHVVVPEVRLQDLEQAAQAGVRAAKTLHERDREAFLDANKSKYPATSRAKWAERYDKDPEATVELLSSAADLVPTGELGHAAAANGEGAPVSLASVRESDDYKSWEI